MDEERVDKIVHDWHERRVAGEAEDPEEMIRTHPDLANALRDRFKTLELVGQAFAELELPPEGITREIGEYRILREIGRGGMGVIYEAEQTSIGRRVALKVLYPSITHSRRAVQRFQREARAAGRLQHTNIVPVHGMGQEGGLWYFSMELVRGRPLGQVIDQIRALGQGAGGDRLAVLSPSPGGTGAARIPEGAATPSTGDRAYYVHIAGMFADVADAVHVAHREGVIHRDIKPSNLILHEDGALKVTDFGLARIEGEGRSLTLSGDILGTPAYMSPEQATGRGPPVDHRTDIYSLGTTLYEILALRSPFEGETPQEICSQILTKDPVLLRRADRRIPKDLETVVSKAMEKDPAKRYRDAQRMAEDLRFFAMGATIRAKPIGPVGRAWRRVKRHKIRAALVTAVVLLAITSAYLAMSVGRESALRKEIEYTRLCTRAEVLLGRSRHRHGSSSEEVPAMVRAVFTQAIALDPGRPEAYLGRALALGSTPEDRLADLDRARSAGLPDRTYHLARGVIFRGLKRDEEASREERLAERLPRAGRRDALLEGWLLADMRGRRKEIIDLLTQVIRSQPEGSLPSGRALHWRAVAREHDGDLEGAIEDLAAFRRVGGDSPFVAVRIASLWRRVGRPEHAGTQFQEALARVRQAGTETAWVELGVACSASGVGPWRDLALEEGLRAHPRSASLLLQRGGSLLTAGEHAKALGPIEEALGIDPDSSRAHAALGETLSGLNRHQEAVRAYDRAIELRPSDASSHSGRALALEVITKGPSFTQGHLYGPRKGKATATSGLQVHGGSLAGGPRSEPGIQHPAPHFAQTAIHCMSARRMVSGAHPRSPRWGVQRQRTSNPLESGCPCRSLRF